MRCLFLLLQPSPRFPEGYAEAQRIWTPGPADPGVPIWKWVLLMGAAPLRGFWKPSEEAKCKLVLVPKGGGRKESWLWVLSCSHK